jgi:hypothetical protein
MVFAHVPGERAPQKPRHPCQGLFLIHKLRGDSISFRIQNHKGEEGYILVTHEQEKLAQKVVDFKVRHFKEGIPRVALKNPTLYSPSR